MNRRDKVKVLIIEDNNYKLEDAIQTLKNYGITDYVHVNNYIEAVHICFRQKRLSEFDFIILDIQFYECRVLQGDRALPDQNAGYKFLVRLAETKSTTPVFVFSSVTDYLQEYNAYLLPSLSEYSRHFGSGPNSLLYARASTLSMRYDEHIKKNKQIIEDTTFVIGHAHNKYELNDLIRTHLNSNNQN